MIRHAQISSPASSYKKPALSHTRGHCWHDVLPRNLAEERIRYAHRALANNCVFILVGTMCGTCMRTIFQPSSPTGKERKHLLSIMYPLNALTKEIERGEHDGCEEALAEFNDLGPRSDLTERELEILTLIGEGLSAHQITKFLKRKAKTVECHTNSQEYEGRPV